MSRHTLAPWTVAVAAPLLVLALAGGSCMPPEVAPPPREVKPKSKAELLIGEWKLVKQSKYQEFRGENETRVEFTKQNKATFRLISKLDPDWPPTKGTYKLEGDRITFTMEGNRSIQARVYVVKINELTSDKLIYTELGDDFMVIEFERVVGKDR